MIDKKIVKKGHVLDHHHQLLMCAPVTPEEIKGALFSMDPMKAPDMDGCNVHLFKGMFGSLNWNGLLWNLIP